MTRVPFPCHLQRPHDALSPHEQRRWTCRVAIHLDTDSYHSNPPSTSDPLCVPFTPLLLHIGNSGAKCRQQEVRVGSGPGSYASATAGALRMRRPSLHAAVMRCSVMRRLAWTRSSAEDGVKLARRMERLGTETAFSVLAKAKALEAEGREIIHLEIGEPDFDTPEHVVEAGCKALRDGHTHYTPTAGIPELREAIAVDVARSRGIDVGPEQVVVTPGGKPIMFFTILALVEEGDEVLLPNPAFPIYESMVNFVGGGPVFVPLRQENGFRFDLDEFSADLSERTRLVILNSPANPTGGVLTADDIAGLADILRERPDVYVLSDEIYSRLLYTDEFASIAS